MLKIKAREARPAKSWWNVCKMLMQSTFFWVIFLFVIPPVIHHIEKQSIPYFLFSSADFFTISLVIFSLGGTLAITSGLFMAIYGQGTPLPLDCPRKLVIVGPYKYVRNPMAIGGLSQGFAVGLFLGSLGVILYTISGLIIWNFFVRRWEEQDLCERFGDSFIDYRIKVYCWWPRFSAYVPKTN
ncbi:isoprenylcysteine carboxylmethyltransferase family protein [Candidatus Uabimicrobium sp. HlEnr_7]|uniref:methyltransferase family protein n=1 Tax=Candidatus Uabimicrobium helgolandensis TaxID=3095367 RepID=UPI00355893F4